MGAFNGLIGCLEVKEELHEELKRNMLKLMSAGGMVQIDSVNLYGKKVYLLKDLSFDEKGDCYFFYNYISDESWEDAGISKKFLWSQKVGSGIFSDVIYAGYTLCSLYNDECCIPHMDAEVVDTRYAIAWINEVLNTKFTKKQLTNYWKLLVSMHKDGNEDWPEIENVIKETLNSSTNVVQILTCLYVQHGFTKIAGSGYVAYDKNASFENFNFVELVQALKDCLKQYKAENGNTELLLEHLKKSRKEKIALIENGENVDVSFKLLTLMLYVNPVVYLKAVAEEFSLEFWQLWDEVGMSFQDMGGLECHTELKEQEAKYMATEAYLQYPWFAYRFNRNEITDQEEEKRITKDDLLYYYTQNEEFPFSENLKKWFVEIGDRYQKLCDLNPNGIYEASDFTKILIYVLEDAEKTYHSVLAFQKMFYEFLANPQDIRYQAAIKLLEELIEENRSIAAKYDPYFKHVIDMTHPNVCLNSGRRCIKHYLALLANNELRKQVLKF